MRAREREGKEVIEGGRPRMRKEGEITRVAHSWPEKYESIFRWLPSYLRTT